MNAPTETPTETPTPDSTPNPAAVVPGPVSVSVPSPSVTDAAAEARRLAAVAAEEATRARAEADKAMAALEAAQAAKTSADARAKTDALAAMTSEAEAMRAARERLESYERRQVRTARINHLRSLGATPLLSDEQLLALAPDVDTDTDEGRAAVDAWRTSNHTLFDRPRLTPQEQADAVIKTIPPLRANNPHTLFDDEWCAKMARDLFTPKVDR